MLGERERVLGPGDPDTVKTRSVLAKALSGDDRDDECADRRRENVVALEREHGADAAETIQALLYLGYAEKDAYRCDEAAAAYTRALAAGERALGPEHTDTVEARRCLAYRHMWAGRFAEAIPLFERVLENFRRNLGDSTSKTLDIRWSLARCRDGSGLCDRALAEYADVLAAAESALPTDHQIRRTLGVDLAQTPQAWRDREVLTGRRLWQVALGTVIVAEVADQGHPLDTLYAGRLARRPQHRGIAEAVVGHHRPAGTAGRLERPGDRRPAGPVRGRPRSRAAGLGHGQVRQQRPGRRHDRLDRRIRGLGTSG